MSPFPSLKNLESKREKLNYLVSFYRSSIHRKAKMSSKLAEEAKKPADASDLENREAAIEEVKRLRKMFKEVTAGGDGAATSEKKKPLLPPEKRTAEMRSK